MFSVDSICPGEPKKKCGYVNSCDLETATEMGGGKEEVLAALETHDVVCEECGCKYMLVDSLNWDNEIKPKIMHEI